MYTSLGSDEPMLIVDKLEDIKDLPTFLGPGRMCLVIENSSVYVLTLSREWVEL